MTGFATILSPTAAMASAAASAGGLGRLIVILGFILFAILSIATLFACWAIAITLSDLLIRRFRKAPGLIARTASDLPLSSTISIIRTIS